MYVDIIIFFINVRMWCEQSTQNVLSSIYRSIRGNDFGFTDVQNF